jgi:DeoR/GlpR family transcriptional regulator of sugar metabolism
MRPLRLTERDAGRPDGDRQPLRPVQASERHQLILKQLELDGRVSVSELSGMAGVSEMTIRRDLEALEQSGALSRVHGGAVPSQSQSYEPPFAARSTRNVEAKQRIGKAAAALLHDGETAILDAGTTTLEIARALRGRRNLRLLALSLHIADLLVDEPGLTVMVAGGIARPGERSLIGSLAGRAFEDLSFDTLFLTVGGVDLEHGLSEYNLDDAAVKRAAFAGSRRRIAVADASKLGKAAFARIAAIEELDVLVTDSDASPAFLDEIRNAGVEVVVA